MYKYITIFKAFIYKKESSLSVIIYVRSICYTSTMQDVSGFVVSFNSNNTLYISREKFEQLLVVGCNRPHVLLGITLVYNLPSKITN